jgi:insulysin
MKVLLVRDLDAPKAAAALSVNIGYLSDPDDIPGMAHFCEHMLFLGTEKYPSENGFSEFLSLHGGQSNASTTAEHTTYYFDVEHGALDEALDRFSQFFISPLFNEESVLREVNAVDAEHLKNQQLDNWRVKQVMRETSRLGHPYRKFGTGNRKSLLHGPAAQGMNIREKLIEFHSNFYSANLMSLVVLGKDPLEDLAAVVEGLFLKVTNRNIPVPVFPPDACTPEELGVMVEVVPVKDVHQILLSFPIEDLSQHYESKPAYYLAYLISHKGRGSILADLKEKGWATSVSAGSQKGGSGFMFFDIIVDLTTEGEGYVNEVIETIFSFLALLKKKGPQQWIFEELAVLMRTEFQFADRVHNVDYVEYLSTMLHLYPHKKVLSGCHLLSQYRPDLITRTLIQLAPVNCRVFHLSPKFRGQTSLLEPWYLVKYNVRRIELSTLEQWVLTGVKEGLQLPSTNEYAPTCTTLVPPPISNKFRVSDSYLLKDTKHMKLWYRHTAAFGMPKVCYIIEFLSPLGRMSPLNFNLLNIYIGLVVDAMSEQSYVARLAGIRYNVMQCVYGVEVEFCGYSEKTEVFMKQFLLHMTALNVDSSKVALHKEMRKLKLSNYCSEQPYVQSMYYLEMLLDDRMWSKEELLHAMEGVSYDELTRFIPAFLSTSKLEVFAHGNISEETAYKVSDIVTSTVGACTSGDLPPSSEPRHNEVACPPGATLTFCRKNVVHTSSSTLLYFRVDKTDLRTQVLMDLLEHIMCESFFDQLRTKEQLGYVVFTRVRRTPLSQGLWLLVQSSEPPGTVLERMLSFTKSFEDGFVHLSEEEFFRYRNSLLIKKSQKPASLLEHSRKLWTEITSDGAFHNENDEMEMIANIAKSELLEFYRHYIFPRGGSGTAITVQVPGCYHGGGSYREGNLQELY